METLKLGAAFCSVFARVFAAKYIQRRYPYPEELTVRAIEIVYNSLVQLHFLC
jgi:hypothetical protein